MNIPFDSDYSTRVPYCQYIPYEFTGLSSLFDGSKQQIVQFLSGMSTTSLGLKRAFTLYACVYILALFVAILVGYANRTLNPMLTVLTADIAATLVIYGAGRIIHNASFYDAYWSIAPLAISLLWFLKTSHNEMVTARRLIVLMFVFIWGLRLTYNWAHQWQGLKHEDWRYRDLRNKTGKWFCLIELVGIDLMPTVIVFLACLSLYPALAAGNKPFGILDVIAGVVTISAIVIEAVADAQLGKFALHTYQLGKIMTKGLWAYSRLPNYFGEIMFWWGIFVFGLAADIGYWWTIIGPLSVTILFTAVSIPLMEKRNLARRPDYSEIRKKIPVLFPWFPKSN